MSEAPGMPEGDSESEGDYGLAFDWRTEHDDPTEICPCPKHSLARLARNSYSNNDHSSWEREAAGKLVR